MSLNKDGLTYDEKEAVIAQALATEEGRTALAQAMVEPIRRSLEYQAVGRKLLMVDELPQGALPRYERDVASTATVIARQGAAIKVRFVLTAKAPASSALRTSTARAEFPPVLAAKPPADPPLSHLFVAKPLADPPPLWLLQRGSGPSVPGSQIQYQ